MKKEKMGRGSGRRNSVYRSKRSSGSRKMDGERAARCLDGIDIILQRTAGGIEVCLPGGAEGAWTLG